MFYFNTHIKKLLLMSSGVLLKCTHTLVQGLKVSEFSLISELFPTFRTILEISVNLKRNILTVAEAPCAFQIF